MFKISFLFILFVFTSIAVYLSNRFAIKLIGKYSHPLGALFFLKIFFTSAIGIMLVSGEYLDNNNNIIEGVKDASIINVTIAFLYSYLIFFLMIFLVFIISKKIDLQKYHTILRESELSKNVLFVYFMLVVMLIYSGYIFYMSNGNLPILLLISGEGSTAVNTLKALFLTDQMDIRIPYFDLLIKIIFPFSSLYILNLIYSQKLDNIKHLKILFYISLLLNLFYLTHDGQKAPFFILLIMIGFLYMYYHGIKTKIIILGLLALIGLQQFFVASFSITESSDTLMEDPFFQRLIIGQSEGMYYMDDWITPNTEYVKHAIPLINKFDTSLTKRADAELMIMKFGVTDIHVNMNTYYLGEAYSMFGVAGYILAPLVVSLSIIIYILIFLKLYKVDYLFFLPISIVFFFNIPITQAFYPFLFQKEAVIQFLMIGIFFSMYKIIIRLRNSEKNILNTRSI